MNSRTLRTNSASARKEAFRAKLPKTEDYQRHLHDDVDLLSQPLCQEKMPRLAGDIHTDFGEREDRCSPSSPAPSSKKAFSGDDGLHDDVDLLSQPSIEKAALRLPGSFDFSTALF